MRRANTLTMIAILSLVTAACSMSPQRVETERAPAAIGPYSQAVKAGHHVYVSGQIPIIPQSGLIAVGDITVQTRQVLENVKAILEAEGLEMSNVVSTTVYLKDINDFGAMNGVYGSYFKQPYPARATTQAARLPKDVAVEISVIAVR